MIGELEALLRRDRIGASDAPACCDRHPWLTSYDLYMIKTGRATEFKGNKYTEAGTYFEPAIRNWFQDKMHAPVATDICLLHSDNIRLANLDGFLDCGDEPGIVEVKTAGLFSGRPVDWGDPADGNDAVPLHIVLQVHQQFSCAEEKWPGVDLCHVPVFLGGNGFQHYRVRRNKHLETAVANRVRRFWEKCIKGDCPPDGINPSPDIAEAIIRIEGKSVPIDEALVDQLSRRREARLAAEKAEKEAKGAVLAALRDAVIGTCGDGRAVVVEKHHRKGFTVEATDYAQLVIKKAI